MKFIYGKQDWMIFQRGEETCFLMTNGLGGFCSLTAIGSCARSEHGVLMACEHAPNRRVQMIQRLQETLTLGEETVPLSSQDFEDQSLREDGRTCQTGFTFRDYPQWTYLIHGVEIVKSLALVPGENTVAITYEIHNRSRREALLRVTPHLRFVPKGEAMAPGQTFTLEENRIHSEGRTLHFSTNAAVRPLPQTLQGPFHYAQDAMDGKPAAGWAAVNHCLELTVPPGDCKVLEAVYGTSLPLPQAAEAFSRLEQHNRAAEKQAGFQDEAARTLARAAGQFLSLRESTGKQTILAGFPFFEDWGRDTMIALGGCCLATRRYDEARSILETFLPYCRRGLMPNLFPEGKDAPWYNTVDASLLFILSIYDYLCRTGDRAFAEKAYDAMADIIDWYEKGTDFSIHMDEDGLISAGSGLDQVTWMDVNVDGILPTPRHGKPVEINAYWYNALRIMEQLTPMLGRGDGARYAAVAERTKKSFREKFWNPEAGCLRDVLSGTKADAQIRCNQIWAVSLPFSILPPEQEKQVVETVFEKLYTPYGLRTLDPADPEFQPFYGGDRLKRDLAYHQGTVWAFPLGGYYLAYLKVHNYSREAQNAVRRQLEPIRSALREGCAGQLPEIYDGSNPVSSKGCFAQAWSVGELLRVYDALEGRLSQAAEGGPSGRWAARANDASRPFPAIGRE
ncbi:MAG: glycogen debranching protein [Oscillibacter sp.]|nr:glycogen debranching protein [Oscillibacter sp.]